jgi:glycerol-3-phosphate dehydrogenase
LKCGSPRRLAAFFFKQAANVLTDVVYSGEVKSKAMTSHRTPKNPVLILGAGINGAALARELVLNGVSVVVVDRQDLAAGTTAYSSRLIHGGLRYLEYGDFELVRESLAERTRWLRLAPHLVKPLRLFIPVENRWGGFGAALRNFIGLARRPEQQTQRKTRGLWAIRAGLWLYDRYARDQTLGRYRVHRLPDSQLPSVNREKYRWACAYYDAQLCFPERFTLELLLDARQAAREAGVEFQLFTYHRAVRRDERIEIVALDGRSTSLPFMPAAIINATGAWVDLTLSELGVPSKKLLGGTKGSHFVTFQRELVELLDGNGVYAEAADGRPVFILPFGEAVLVGTTDETFAGDPDTARATPAELRYLMAAVHEVFPQITLDDAGIELVYSGVRPLPATGPTTPAAITRRHWLEEHTSTDLPCYSIVGGKLTTCRSLAESAARTILARLGRPQRASSQERPLPGSEHSPSAAQHAERNAIQNESSFDDQALAERFSVSVESIAAVRGLYGTRTQTVLPACLKGNHAMASEERTLLHGTPYPIGLARYMVEHEWVRRLEDFVERRLMLLYHRPLTRRCLEQLADVLVTAGVLEATQRGPEIESTVERLRDRFKKRTT